MQPRARATRNRLTRRSSSEWKEIAGEATAVGQQSQASGSAASSCPSSSLTAIRSAWKVRLAGWPPANRAGRDGRLDHVDELLRRRRAAPRPRAATIAPGDLAGVALLAVVAQQAGQPALVPGVDDLRAVSAWSGPCACRAARRRHRRSRAPRCRPASTTSRGRSRRVGADALATSSSRPSTKSARMKRVWHATSAGQLGEALLGGGSRSMPISVPAGPIRPASRRA